MTGVILHSATTITGLLRQFFVAEHTAASDGILQRLHPREKLLSMSALLVAVVVTRRPLVLIALAALPVALAYASRVPLRRLFARSAFVPLVSIGIVAPQTILMPGPSLVELVGVSVTTTGIGYVLTFVLRVWITVALLSLVVLTTPFSAVLAALRRLRVPVSLVWTIALTYRYLFLFFSELQRLLLARRSRTFGDRGLRGSWRDAGRLSGTFLLRVIDRGERVHTGMRARGGSRAPSPYPSTDPPGIVEVLFVVGAIAVMIAAGVVRWIA